MSCGYDRHGCGTHAHESYGRGPCDHVSWRRVGWLDEAGLPMERRYRRPRQPDPELATEDLGARLEQLRLMVREIEAEILALGSSGEGGNLE